MGFVLNFRLIGRIVVETAKEILQQIDINIVTN